MTAFDPTHPNYDQIQALLQQKANANKDESKRIRRQLRALGYSLREQSGGAALGTTGPGTVVQRERKARAKRDEADPTKLIAPTGRRRASALIPADSAEMKAIMDDLDKAGLQCRDLASSPSEEWGYGFDVPHGCTADHLMDKFNARWPGVQPQWYGGYQQGDSLLIVLGPVEAELRVNV